MLLFKGVDCFTANGIEVMDIAVVGNVISTKGCSIPQKDGTILFPSKKLLIIPGLADAHVHLREPGFFYKETIASGTLAAAAGGYTAVFSMPNVNPVPDSLENLAVQEKIISESAKINVYPYAAITVGEKGEKLSDMRALAGRVKGFSDDGRGVQRREMMKEAMLIAKETDRTIVAHCEDTTLLDGGYIHKGTYSARHGHKGISSESEWMQVERDLELAKETGVKYHVCHVSTKESVELIRKAKKQGVRVTCETAPHYLVLCDEDIKEDGRFKMNPPLRSAKDREALVCGLADGTVDIIATDHAPHSAEEKGRGLQGSLMGVVGLECAFPVLYTQLVLKGKLSLERLIDAMSTAPRRIFGLDGGIIEEGAPADLAVFDLSEQWTVRGEEFLSKGKSTPFEGMTVKGRNLMTILDGEIIWKM